MHTVECLCGIHTAVAVRALVLIPRHQTNGGWGMADVQVMLERAAPITYAEVAAVPAQTKDMQTRTRLLRK